MGRERRKYSCGKASSEQYVATNHIKVEGLSLKGEDSSNPLVLPKYKIQRKKQALPKVAPKLSNKERKKLKKIVDQKKKKEKRAGLLAALSTVQVDSTELAMLDSIAHIGTKNSKLSSLSKRPLPQDLQNAIENRSEGNNILKGWSGKKKRRKLTKSEKPPLPNVAKEQESSDVSTSSDDDEVNGTPPATPNDTDCNETLPHIPEDSVTNQEVKVIPKVIENLKTSAEEANEQSTTAEVKTEEKKPLSKPAVYVHVDRTTEMQEARLRLPILAEEQAIMEAISENFTVIICGETGSGKTTQVPQFLYEGGYATKGMIGITEPRRVAAVSMSKRVATEMNLEDSGEISFHIRYKNNVSEKTRVKFMTDGVLMREVKEDFLLLKYSVIVLDEAHERTTNTDVLIGLLSRIIPLRNKKGKPLKLVIMSATLRVEDFTKNQTLFKVPPPVIKIDVRQFYVKSHFNKRTPGKPDGKTRPYLRAAYKKICKIHRTLPPGGILVFLTGSQEIHTLIRTLNATFPSTAKEIIEEPENKRTSKLVSLDNYKAVPSAEDEDEEESENRVEQELEQDEEGGEMFDDDVAMDDSAFTTEIDQSIPLHVLPLYSLLPYEQQNRVFEPVPEGCRLCVVATNVAETSLTIPGIKYVVDTGMVKKREYDKITGASRFEVDWISKASADQRAGRAGRTAPGHAYRLYSSAVFQEFLEFDKPDIAMKPAAGVVLMMKSMKIDRIINFPFPTPPPRESLESAEKLLVSLGAVRVAQNKGTLKEIREAKFSGSITPFGQLMSLFPVHPRYGKMIAISTQHSNDVISYVITIVAALTVRELFITKPYQGNSEEENKRNRQHIARLHHLKALWSTLGGGPERKLLGDLMVLLGAVGAGEFNGNAESFCLSSCISLKAFKEIRMLRSQLTNVVKCATDNSELCLDFKMPPPSDKQIRLLRQIVLSALGDHVAKKMRPEEIPSEKRNIMRGAYESLLFDEAVYIHPDSVLSRDPLPDYVIFQEITETKESKPYMRDITVVLPEWLPTFCSNYCKFSKPLEDPQPTYDPSTGRVKCHTPGLYGRLAWPLGTVEIEYPPSVDRYRWFGRFFLEGKVITSLKAMESSLLGRPVSMVKSWAKLQPRTETLLRALLSKQVDDKGKLVKVWEEDPTYLRSAYLEWLPQSLHANILLSWPPS